MGSMGHDNESWCVEHWVDSKLRRFSRSLWRRLEESEAKPTGGETKQVMINGRLRTFDAALWAEAVTESGCISW